MTTVTLKGVDELQEFLAEVEHELTPEGAEDIMHLVVGMLHRYASAITPVDTGRLKNSEMTSVNRSSSAITGLVYTNVEYAPPVEKRTKFFARTIQNEGPNALKLFDENIASVITG